VQRGFLAANRLFRHVFRALSVSVARQVGQIHRTPIRERAGLPFSHAARRLASVGSQFNDLTSRFATNDQTAGLDGIVICAPLNSKQSAGFSGSRQLAQATIPSIIV
jgi:hypothetical protein